MEATGVGPSGSGGFVMSAAPAAIPKSSPAVTPAPVNAAVPAVAELEDLLFDILATGGVDPNIAASTQQAVQVFVHEHARERKTHGEFVAFFEHYALSMKPDRPNLLVLPPLEVRGRATETPAIKLQPLDPPIFESAPVVDAGMRKGWVIAAAVLAAAVGGALAFGCFALIETHSELEHARVDAVVNAAQLQRLRDETAELRSEVSNTAQLVRQIDHNSQRMLQTFATPLDRNAP
jgi:hypothetical protein